MGNGLYWTNWDKPAHDHWSPSYDGLDDSDTIYGLEAHDVLWIDGAIATQDQIAALGVTFIPIAQA